MLETMTGLTQCGTLLWNGTFEEVYCDKYGTLVFENSDGCWCISEVNIGKPLPVNHISDLVANINNDVYGEECIGVVYGFDGNIVVFKNEEYAVERKLWEPAKDCGEPFYYSTDEEYNMEEYESYCDPSAIEED